MNRPYTLFLLGLVFSIFYTNTIAQTRHYLPLWSFHQKNITIDGLSIGLWTPGTTLRNTMTNGLKLEVGFGPLFLMIPESPVAYNDSIYQTIVNSPLSEKINGISISSATSCYCQLNGLAISGFGNYYTKINGFSIGLFDLVQSHNGIQVGFINDAFKLNGIQIGIFNISKKTRGIQIGLWNKNEKRKLPFFNWNFKR